MEKLEPSVTIANWMTCFAKSYLLIVPLPLDKFVCFLRQYQVTDCFFWGGVLSLSIWVT